MNESKKTKRKRLSRQLNLFTLTPRQFNNQPTQPWWEWHIHFGCRQPAIQFSQSVSRPSSSSCLNGFSAGHEAADNHSLWLLLASRFFHFIHIAVRFPTTHFSTTFFSHQSIHTFLSIYLYCLCLYIAWRFSKKKGQRYVFVSQQQHFNAFSWSVNVPNRYTSSTVVLRFINLEFQGQKMTPQQHSKQFIFHIQIKQ